MRTMLPPAYAVCDEAVLRGTVESAWSDGFPPLAAIGGMTLKFVH